jgi:hypothetical protein
MRWHRVRDTAPNVQSFETETYQTEVVQADADVAGDQQLRHAKEQLTIAKQYPGRAQPAIRCEGDRYQAIAQALARRWLWE